MIAIVLAFAAQDFQWPVSGSYEQGFYDAFSGKGASYYYDHNHTQQYFAGYNVTGTRLHRAIDIGCVTGTTVRAARWGWAYQYSDSSYGNFVIVEHESGYYTLYAHLSSYATSWGQYVETGQTVGYSGATGFVTGPHLHFEIRHSGSTSYGAYAHYVPGSNIGAGNEIPFDYPNIGPIAGGGPPAGPGGLWAQAQSGTEIYFQWDGVWGADGYWLDIALSWDDLVNMTGSFMNHYNGGSTSFTWGGLIPGATYYWRVYAFNAYGGNHGYPAGPVTTPSGGGPPGQPGGLWPNDWTWVSGSSVTLDWWDVADAWSYEVQILYWTGSSWANYYTYSAGGSALSFWPQIHWTYYAWRVRASNGAGAGAWSDWAYWYYNN